MRRHWLVRALGILGAARFILIGMDAAAIGDCPMLQLPAAVSSHAGHAMPAAMDHASMHHNAGGDNDTQAPGQHESHQCTCPGSCCGPILVAPTPAQAALGVVATISAPLPTIEHRLRSRWTDVVLPFATAPPQGLLA